MPEFSEPKNDLPPLHESLDDRVNLKFYFAPHNTPVDARGMEHHLASADVYMPEYYGVPVEDRELISKIGRGDVAAYRKFLSISSGPFATEWTHMLMRRSRKGSIDVFVPDVPSDSYWNPLMWEKISLLKKVATHESVDETLTDLALRAKRIGEIGRLRDDFIAKSIASYIDRRIEEGTLPHSRPLNILSSFGPGHIGLTDRLRVEGYPVEVCADSALTGDHRDELILIYQSGSLPTYDQVQKGYISTVLYSLLETDNSGERNQALRQIVDGISPEDLERICSVIVRGRASAKVLGEVLEELTGHSKLGPQEIDEILSSAGS